MMSIYSWKEEFITHTGNLSTDGKNKWIGIRKENLKRHGLSQEDEQLIDKNGPFKFDAHRVFNLSECGLCDIYIDYGCIGCPLYIVRGRVSCDEKTDDEAKKDIKAPYEAGVYGDPEPIIAWLQKAEKYESSMILENQDD